MENYTPDPPSPVVEVPEIVSVRPDLAGKWRHTVTVERVDRETARHWIDAYRGQWEDLIGRLAVVERHEGRLAKVCAIAGVYGLGDTQDRMEQAARGTARTYGAEYVERAAAELTRPPCRACQIDRRAEWDSGMDCYPPVPHTCNEV